MPKHFALRGLFIFHSNGSIAMSERFSTVASREPRKCPPLPSNSQISTFFSETALPSLTNNGCTFHFQLDVNTFLVVMPTKNFYIAGIPLIQSDVIPDQLPIEISVTLSILSYLETLSRSALKSLTPTSPPSAYAPLRQIVTLVLPFGTPIVDDPYFASQLTSNGDMRRFGAGYQTIQPAAVPSWKSFLVFPRPQLELKLREVIVGYIDGQQSKCDIYGEIRCIASISYLPDVTIQVPGLTNTIEKACHYCVKKVDGKAITFSPPTGVTQLMTWRLPLPTPPVTGVYTVTENEEGLSFSLQINLGPSVREAIIQLPFPGRGSITKHQFSSPGGQLRMSKKEATISWNMKADIAAPLIGTLNFENPAPADSERCKVFVNFTSKEKSMSGTEIEKETIAFSNSSSNVALSTDASFTTENKRYIIWASQ